MALAGSKPVAQAAATGGIASSSSSVTLEPVVAPSNTVDPAALKAVEATSSPFRVGVTGRSNASASEIDNPSFIPPAVRRYFGNRRILVVDDFAFTLTEIERDMGAFFDDVTALSDPREVAQHLREARDAGQPYDAMVLDLRMPHLNGDELLRHLAKHDLLLPTVIHSGSHASAIQTSLFPQIEQARTEVVERRMAKLTEQEEAFARISSPEELHAWRTQYVRMTDGVPLTFVHKAAWTNGDEGLPHMTLARALARVMIVGEETDWTNFRQSVARFKPVLWEGGDMTEYIEALVETGRFMAGKVREMKERLEALVPEIGDNRYWINYCTMLAEISGPGYSHSGLSGEAYEWEGAGARRHNFPSLVQAFGNNLSVIMKRFEPLREALERNPELKEEVDAFNELGKRIGQFVPIFRSFAETRTAVQLDEDFSLILSHWRHRTDVECEDTDLYISSPGSLWHIIIEQPLMNAIQWTEGNDENIAARLGKRSVGSLDAASRAYFVEEHGCSDDDEVVMLAVIDKGPGIPADKLGEIFDRRYSTRLGGTGFGLAFLKEHIGKLNGTYYVESEIGEGTAFYMYFLPATPES